MFSPDQIARILALYESGQSPYEICVEFHTYPNKIRRLLKSLGVKLRDHSDAQKAALNTGRSTNPMEGKHWSEEDKQRIAEQQTKYWRELSEAEREKISKERREQWDAMTEAEQRAFIKAGHKACNRAGRNGSEMERYLRDELESEGYHVVYHKKSELLSEKLEIDLLLPELKVAIEVQGPTHFIPLFGQERLETQLEIDSRKLGLLLHGGYTVVRVNCHFKKNSPSRKNQARRDLLNLLKALRAGEIKDQVLDIDIH